VKTAVADVLARARKLRREGALDEAARFHREALERQPKYFEALPGTASAWRIRT
jgi:hypothetical protein